MNLPSLTKAEFYALLDPFMKLLETEQNERVKEQYPSLHESALKEGRRGYTEIGYDEGLRFVKVWADRGGKYVKYFVEKDTGIIFGAKGWKAYNPIHVYGDLTTIADWSWGEYYAKGKNGQKSMVPKAFRR